LRTICLHGLRKTNENRKYQIYRALWLGQDQRRAEDERGKIEMFLKKAEK